jgi:hypothetical protein
MSKLVSQIIVGCIVTRSPSSSMASSAFIELGLACDLFEKGAMHSRRARSGLVSETVIGDLLVSLKFKAILYKMREKAFQVYSQFRTGTTVSSKVLAVDKPDYGDDELALFGGQTRVLVSKLLNSSKKMRKQSVSSPAASLSSPSSEGDARGTPSNDVSREVHPSLVEYLAMFPPSNAPSRSSSDGHRNTMEGGPTPLILPPEPQQEQYQMWPNWAPPSLFTPLPMENITTELAPFSNNQSSTTAETTPVEIKTDLSDASLVDLGMMMTGESGMDEQWISFMRDSGLLQIDGNATGMYHDFHGS